MAKDKSLEEQYKAEINKLIHKGDIEEVSENQLEASDPKRHINYLPQIVVQRQEKVTSKVRCSMLQVKTTKTCLLMIISCVDQKHRKASTNYQS